MQIATDETERPDADQRYLARQLVKYADATTAFAVIQNIAFAIALGSNELGKSIRCTPTFLIPSLCGVALVVYLGIVVCCHTGENSLIRKASRTRVTRRWAMLTWCGRYAVMVLVEGVVLVGIYYTRRGGRC